MKNLNVIFASFLEAQGKRLKQRTYNDYEDVIELFKIYLNSYGYLDLDGKDLETWESHYENDEESFTKLFGIDKIDFTIYNEFFEYFIIRKVDSGESYMKKAVRVMKKFTNWLKENDNIQDKQHEELLDYFIV